MHRKKKQKEINDNVITTNGEHRALFAQICINWFAAGLIKDDFLRSLSVISIFLEI